MELTLSPSSPTLLALLQRPDDAQFTHHVIFHLRPCELDSDDMRQVIKIICQMSSLRKVEICYRVGSPVLDFIHQVAPSSFSQLQAFRLQPEPLEGPSDWKQMDISAVPVLQISDLPEAEELYLHGLELTSNSSAADLGRSFQTRRLTLKECQIKAPELGLLLSHSPRLTSLDCGVLIDAEKAREWFDLTMIKQGLASFYSTLKHLSISFELATSTAIDTGNEGTWGIRSSLTSLKSFSQLQSLEISFVTLLGWNASSAPSLSEVLPQGLQQLVLTRDEAFWWGYQWDEGFATGTIRNMIQKYVEPRQGHLRELALHVPEGMGSFEIDVPPTRDVKVKIIEDEF
ncbi:hypothetical protein ONS95_001561 [Cadophora gregata]|uniref:uncharacterized protein n=1 Tax=Cadophora gregata TaxID=51156 RepID=UPI0026DC008C|nr:uncharacterized protein ONS95_001561 [Cadophora gregata]KAK0111185.1 hypothetical protein ONS95_001561 [Cadophora gregata]KAK0112344.1 hypothetical protein ONS96_001591 [Cadophora gregata f. sp. sojae]